MLMRILILLSVAVLLFVTAPLAFTEDNSGDNKILILREAKEDSKATVAVEAYLIEDILEVKVIARMEREKPRIYNVIVVGPKIGRVVSEAREVLFPAMENEEPFPTKEREGFLSFDDKKKDKEAKGTLTKELLRFKIPREKIIKGKRYQLWVKIESMKSGGKSNSTSFKFDLENLH